MFIYLIRNTVNQKCYVGKTERTVLVRWQEHLASGESEKHFRLHRAIRKYGQNNFSTEILSSATTVEELALLEKLWILALGTWDENFGYNMTFGGDGGSPTKESREKISAALKGRQITWGDKIAKTLQGRKAGEETKLAMREAAKVRPPRKPHTQETKDLISKVTTGKKRSKEFCMNISAKLKGRPRSIEVRKQLSIAMTQSHARRRDELVNANSTRE